MDSSMMDMGTPMLSPEVLEALRQRLGQGDSNGMPPGAIVTSAPANLPVSSPAPVSMPTTRPGMVMPQPVSINDVQAMHRQGQMLQSPGMRISVPALLDPHFPKSQPQQSNNVPINMPTAEPPVPVTPPATPARPFQLPPELQAGPAEERYQKMMAMGPQKHTGGFGSRMKDVGIAALEGLATGKLLAPVQYGLMTAINPQFRHNLDFRNQMNAMGPVANQEMALRNARTAEQLKYGQMMGIDPFTSQPTAAQQNAQDKLEALQAQHQAATEKFQKQLDETIEQHKRMKEHWDNQKKTSDEKIEQAEKWKQVHGILESARIPGRQIDDDKRKILEDTIGAKLPQDFDSFKYTIKPDATGEFKLFRINQRTGQLELHDTGVQGKRPAIPAYQQEVAATDSLLNAQGFKRGQDVPNPKYPKSEIDQYMSQGMDQATAEHVYRKKHGGKVPPATVKAETLFTKSDVQAERARLYGAQAESAGGGGTAPVTVPGKTPGLKPTTQTGPKFFPANMVDSYAADNKMTREQAEAHLKNDLGYTIK